MVQAFIRKIDALTEVIGKATMGLALLLVVLVMADVAMRYVFSISFASVRELEWHIYSLLFLFGGAYTLRHDGHVRVDVAYQHFSPRMRALVNVIGCLIFLFPGCYLVIRTSAMFTKFSWMMGEQSPDPGGLPFRWFLKGCLPVAFGLLALQGVSFFLKNLLVLLGKAEAEEA